MLVILEGPDNSGKSSLAMTLDERLKKRSGQYKFLLMNNGRTLDREELWARVIDALHHSLSPDRLMLCERFHTVSELVYRMLDGKPINYSSNQMVIATEGICTRKNCRIIYCRPPLVVAQRAAHELKGDDDPEWGERIMTNLPKIFHSYDRLMAGLSRKGAAIVHYDYTDPWSLDLVMEHICAD